VKELSDGTKVKYYHPYFQCLIMFIAEFLCLILFKVKQIAYPNDEKYDKINTLWIAIPSCFDIIASSIFFIGFTLCAASVSEMLNGWLIVMTALMA
jgi:hypothetical protein